MTVEPSLLLRLQFLCRVVGRESDLLALTDERLFALPVDAVRVRELTADVALAERVEAFVGRFSRLQDTLGDKLLPAVMGALGEKPGVAIDNLDFAERLGWIDSAERWMVMRKLRNQMVHEYIEDPVILAGALQAGHEFVQELIAAGQAMVAALARHGLAEANDSTR